MLNALDLQMGKPFSISLKSELSYLMSHNNMSKWFFFLNACKQGNIRPRFIFVPFALVSGQFETW